MKLLGAPCGSDGRVSPECLHSVVWAASNLRVPPAAPGAAI